MSKKKRINPFYVLLVLVGIAFTITASAYGVMTFRASQPVTVGTADDAAHPLWHFVDRYGTWALLGELVTLGVFTFGAIGLDQYRDQREQRKIRE